MIWTLPGTGGQFVSSAQDFIVEEIPVYEPCGSGEHVYVRFEKQNLTTRQVIRRAVEGLGISDKDVGYAGLKDKHSTSRQTISIHGITPDAVQCLEGDDLQILSVNKHKNKLRVGHLRGNRFRARISGVNTDALTNAKAMLDAAQTQGMPNTYGHQRFGRHGGNAAAAKSMLLEGKRIKGSRWKAKLMVSALQSHLFNLYLKGRQDRGVWDVVHVGDVLQKVESGGMFPSDSPEVDQQRYNDFEVSITGPIFGGKMVAAPDSSQPAQWETDVLQAEGMTREHFRTLGKLGPGTRRPLRVKVSNASVDAADDALWLAFDLPSGAYATVLIDLVIGSSQTASID